MLIIPAIDIKNGKCVRLSQGQMDKETIYSENPIEVAEKWVREGAKRVHIVDLDGAIEGKPVNIDVIHSIAKSFPDIPLQVGGGIRDEDTIQTYLDAGVSYVIIGTRAVTTPHFVSDICLEFPGHIIVGLDAKNGKLATDGWSKLSNHDVNDMAKRFEEEGVAAIIFTDISRDGMLNSINIEATVTLCREISIPVIAAGGVTNLDDIHAVCEISEEGILGVITGRAIYEGTLSFVEAQNLVNKKINRKK
ncbi:MAG: 1-(5-phosphoribosyl)-5-[(5-phosphoribosylamino)methylideneamino]imidazole-4-carboxamide isomerase [Pseudomonadota bacterium]|nr:1-(5-phosphoribosyl)-5-[(5-phosphoribosylamino)methylideneamino]imidazole-4-carboxamide isomerase [Pseudomonadota bacterium]|tara:strand:+ start:2799 stop:3545 length:747 start_codon:yes stop_codon:yes gene_type:complete